MSDPLAVINEFARRWNAGDVDGSLELYADDAEMLSSPEWPEQFKLDNREAIGTYTRDWVATWESSEVEVQSVEVHGDKVVVSAVWVTRGRSSGAEGTMPVVILFTVRHGKIAVLEWHDDYDAAVRAARGA